MPKLGAPFRITYPAGTLTAAGTGVPIKISRTEAMRKAFSIARAAFVSEHKRDPEWERTEVITEFDRLHCLVTIMEYV